MRRTMRHTAVQHSYIGAYVVTVTLFNIKPQCALPRLDDR